MKSKFQTKLDNQTFIKGDFTSLSDIHIDGNIKGNINTNGRVYLGENSKVKGNIQCHSLNIEGTIEGDSTANKKISLSPTADVKGDLNYANLSIEQGAHLHGKCTVSD